MKLLYDFLTFTAKSPTQAFSQQFHSACLVVLIVCSVFVPMFCFLVTSIPTVTPLFIIRVSTYSQLSELPIKYLEKKNQYEVLKQCMNKSFPALNTPLSKWSRGFSRTIYITVADTVFKFSCQSQDGILNHPIFLNEVMREF